MKQHIIIGIHVTDRLKNILDVQKLLTEYGVYIKTRLGLHELDDTDIKTPKGLIILEMSCPNEACEEFIGKLQALEGVECQRMIFSHP